MRLRRTPEATIRQTPEQFSTEDIEIEMVRMRYQHKRVNSKAEWTPTYQRMAAVVAERQARA